MIDRIPSDEQFERWIRAGARRRQKERRVTLSSGFIPTLMSALPGHPAAISTRDAIRPVWQWLGGVAASVIALMALAIAFLPAPFVVEQTEEGATLALSPVVQGALSFALEEYASMATTDLAALVLVLLTAIIVTVYRAVPAPAEA